MNRAKLELMETKCKELVDTCFKRADDGLDCSGCKYENNCYDILKEVFKLECLYDR